MFKELFLAFVSGSFGVLSAAGVFTVFSTVGMVPRFAGKTHSAKEIFLYENMIVLGTIMGCLVSIWPDTWNQTLIRIESIVGYEVAWWWFQRGMLVVIGLFSGMFVGCFALSIAEMLDSIPIFTRRIAFRKGIGLAVCSVAVGKMCGALFYFLHDLERTM